MVAPLSDRDELLAIAAWRQVLLDRAAGREQAPEVYAGMFPSAASVLLAEMVGDFGERPGVVVGHYRLIELLGRGGQGSVWCAADLQLSDRQVALKLIPMSGRNAPGAALRLRREIALALRADVPGVCPVYDTGQDGDYAWIAMRRCEGTTLAQRLSESPSADRPTVAQIEQRVQWLEHAARVVHHVHERGVVHRDLKPGNLMIADDGSCVLLDFGVARALDDGAKGVTVTGASPGTPAFMAPEQVLGHEVGPAADIWALGVMLFEGVTGQRPFSVRRDSSWNSRSCTRRRRRRGGRTGRWRWIWRR
ncbi:MAG: serine/threonine protein kinase [Planctomycetes bacterium]|nr:serine/threonine protein kinase [Planctomycetota bacterium]